MVALKVETQFETIRLLATRGPEPHEGGGVVRAWIVVDPRVYSGISMPKDGSGCVVRQWRLQAVILSNVVASFCKYFKPFHAL